MGDDIGSGLSSTAVCFDFRLTNIVQLSNQNLYFYQFQCHHPLIIQLSCRTTTYIRNNMGQKCEGNCGLWVLNEMIKKNMLNLAIMGWIGSAI